MLRPEDMSVALSTLTSSVKGYHVMEEKTRKMLGCALIAYSGIILLFFIARIALPSMAQIADNTLISNVRSLWLIYLSFELGRSLVRGMLEGASFMRIMVSVFMFVPIIALEQALKMKETSVEANWLSWSMFFLLASSVAFVIMPYLLEGQILKWLSERKSRHGINPWQGLSLIGVVCSVMPSMLGLFNQIFMTIGKRTLCQLVAISYVAAIVWWIWWNNRYSRTVRRETGPGQSNSL